MKVRIYLKDPDGFFEAVKEAVEEEVNKLEGLDEEEGQDLIETRTEKVWEKLERWVEYREYVGIVFDIDAMTAEVETRK